MALNTKDPETGQPGAPPTGESITRRADRRPQAAGARGTSSARAPVDDLLAIARRCASRSVVDDRSADEIIGYDERGLP